MSQEYRVIIVVSAEHAPRVERLARECPVWAIRTPETEAVARQVWDQGGLSDSNLTLFSADEDPEASLLSVVDEVELHHGTHSHDPAVGVIEVLGTSLTDALRDAFQSLGFSRFDSTPEGFLARRG